MADEFQWAIKNGDLDGVKKQVTEKGVSVNSELTVGRFPLHVASDYGQLDVCTYLVENGANVDQPDKHGITPLLAAIWEDHVEVCKFLLKSGADKNGKAPDGIPYALSSENKEIKALLK